MFSFILDPLVDSPETLAVAPTARSFNSYLTATFFQVRFVFLCFRPLSWLDGGLCCSRACTCRVRSTCGVYADTGQWCGLFVALFELVFVIHLVNYFHRRSQEFLWSSLHAWFRTSLNHGFVSRYSLACAGELRAKATKRRSVEAWSLLR